MMQIGPHPVTLEAARRRTFAIISHPDAGKTTLTEKLLLYAGAIQEAGAVKARRARRAATSDWMRMERERGISITSTVLRFTYRDTVFNLLDTPGHHDFSEDTYRVLTAADSALMVLDAAKGVEPQTLRLFEVCRDRGIPLLTFVNKCDRPGLGPLEILDDIERSIGVRPTPVTWPVGEPGDFRGVLDRRDGSFLRFERTARGATMAPEERLRPDQAHRSAGEAWEAAVEETALLDVVGAAHEASSFLTGHTSPLFFGSALTNFGVRSVLEALIHLAPAPGPRADTAGVHRELGEPFAAFVFKVQANLDPKHRDRIAFLRICSGRFERGMTTTLARTGRPFALRYAHEVFGRERETLDEGYPGDVVGVVNATDLRLGDTLYADDPVTFPPMPSFQPEHFVRARHRDADNFKRYRRGLAQLEEEGVVQVLREPDLGDQAPILAAVGPMQFEVVLHRLRHEFGAEVELQPLPYGVARRTDAASALTFRGLRDATVVERSDGAVLMLVSNVYRLEQIRRDHPDLTLERIVAR